VVRVYELRNIAAQIADHGNLLLGDGPGAKFSDAYYPFPFGLREGADYTLDDIIKRQFRVPHTIFASLLLVGGYGGMAIYFLIMFIVFLSAFRYYWSNDDPVFRRLLLALTIFLPIMVYSAWCAKTKMLLGITLGLLGCVCAWAQRREVDPCATPDEVVQGRP
jgi:hypothetical protein